MNTFILQNTGEDIHREERKLTFKVKQESWIRNPELWNLKHQNKKTEQRLKLDYIQLESFSITQITN